MAAKNNEIYEFLSGLDDNGSAISLNVETKQGSLDTSFETIINPVELIIEVIAGNGISIMVAYDDGPFKTVGVVNKGCTRLTLDVDPATGDFPRCRQITIAYREFSESTCVLGRLAILYYETEESEEKTE